MMNKQSIKKALANNSKVIIETVEHERIPVNKIEDNKDNQYIYVLEPKKEKIEIDKITDIQENNFNQL